MWSSSWPPEHTPPATVTSERNEQLLCNGDIGVWGALLREQEKPFSSSLHIPSPSATAVWRHWTALPGALLVQVAPPVQWPLQKHTTLSPTSEHSPRTDYPALIKHESRHSWSHLLGKILCKPNSIHWNSASRSAADKLFITGSTLVAEQWLSCTAPLNPTETMHTGGKIKANTSKMGGLETNDHANAQVKKWAVDHIFFFFGIRTVKYYNSEQCVALIKFCDVSTKVPFGTCYWKTSLGHSFLLCCSFCSFIMPVAIKSVFL